LALTLPDEPDEAEERSTRTAGILAFIRKVALRPGIPERALGWFRGALHGGELDWPTILQTFAVPVKRVDE